MRHLKYITYLLSLLMILSMPIDTMAQKKKSSSKARTTATTKTKGKSQKTKAKSQGSRAKTTTKSKTTSTSSDADAQYSTKEINSLRDEKKNVQKEIAKHEKNLRNNQADVRKGLKKIDMLHGEIENKQRTIAKIEGDINILTTNIGVLSRDLDTLRMQYKARQKEYARSMRNIQKIRGNKSDMYFIVSADGFSEMLRRMRFLKEYSDYLKEKGDELTAQRLKVEQKKGQLEQTKTEKDELLAKDQKEKQNLEIKKKEQQNVVNSLKAKQKEIQSELATQRQKSAQLNAKIDKLIAIEIEKARKRAEAAAAKRRAEEAAKKKAAAAKKRAEEAAKKSISGGIKETETTTTETPTSSTVKVTETNITSSKVAADAQNDFINGDDADRKLSGNFANNKGRMPMPITGSYRVISHFGKYNVSGLTNVTLDNKGMNIQGKAGARARCIFDGEVSAIFSFDGTMVVMVRHGSYISVYCNLASVSVSRGQKVSARQILGTIASDHILQFQLRHGTAKLNPEEWVR